MILLVVTVTVRGPHPIYSFENEGANSLAPRTLASRGRGLPQDSLKERCDDQWGFARKKMQMIPEVCYIGILEAVVGLLVVGLY